MDIIFYLLAFSFFLIPILVKGFSFVDILPLFLFYFDATEIFVSNTIIFMYFENFLILGYSLYDTVVVFDRVRDNTKSISSLSTKTYSQAVNLAVNQTIVRSANTSIVAILPVAAILFVGAGLLGAGTLKDLSLSLFIGLIVGTYSSIFIAPAVLAQLREKEPAMQALAKRVNSRTAPMGVATPAPAVTEERRGPRNQPKRKHRK